MLITLPHFLIIVSAEPPGTSCYKSRPGVCYLAQNYKHFKLKVQFLKLRDIVVHKPTYNSLKYDLGRMCILTVVTRCLRIASTRL